MRTSLGIEDGLHGALDVRLEDRCLGELLVPVGGEPDTRQWPLLAQHKLSVEHRDWFATGHVPKRQIGLLNELEKFNYCRTLGNRIG